MLFASRLRILWLASTQVQQERPCTRAPALAISDAEWRWALTVSFMVLGLTTLPYLLAWMLTPPGHHFTGLLPYLADGNTYLAKMEQGRRGAWLYTLAYSPEPHDGAFVWGLFLLLGKLAGLLHLPNIIVLHAARLGAGLAALLMAYAFYAFFTGSVAMRRLAFLLVACTSGTGWFFTLLGAKHVLGEFPVDIHFPDATLFWSIYAFPNYSFSAALMLACTLLVLLAFRRNSMLPSVWAGLAGAALAVTHPSILVVYATLTLYLALLWWRRGQFPRRELRLALPFGLLSAPAVVYETWVLHANWAFKAFTDQNFNYSPGVPTLLVSFGVLLWLAWKGAPPLWRRSHNEPALPVLWTFLVPVLLYTPVSVQRRFLEGWNVPMSLLVAFGLVTWLFPRLRHAPALQALLVRERMVYDPRRWKRFVLTLVLALLIPSNLIILAGSVALAAAHAPHIYLSPGENGALEWLRANSRPDEAVLSGLDLGNRIPAQAGNRVFFGHWSESIYAGAKAELVVRFFEDRMSDEERRDLLRRYRIAYIWHGREEQRLGRLDPARVPYFTPVYRSEDVTLYRVELSP
jgi:hypothetical protein